MKKLLLLSNGTVAPGGYLEYARPWIQDHFQASLENRKKVLFVGYALKDQDAYAEKARKALEPLGIDIVSAHTAEDPRTLLNQVDGVFVGGGNTFRLLDGLQRNGLGAAIKAKVEAGMPYMGASAGTNVATPTIKTTNDMPIVHPESLDAMNLVNFQINPHYVDGKFYYEGEIDPALLSDLNHASFAEAAGEALANKIKQALKLVVYNGESRADRIKEFHEENTTPVVGLREGSALRVIGDRIELLGSKPAKVFLQGKDPIEVSDGIALSAHVSERNGLKQAV